MIHDIGLVVLKCNMVKTAPNKAVANANIKNIKKTSEPDVYLASVEILSSKPVEGFADFVNPFIGKIVEAKLFAPESDHIILNKPVKLAIRYEGDERGGAFLAQKHTETD